MLCLYEQPKAGKDVHPMKTVNWKLRGTLALYYYSFSPSLRAVWQVEHRKGRVLWIFVMSVGLVNRSKVKTT